MNNLWAESLISKLQESADELKSAWNRSNEEVGTRFLIIDDVFEERQVLELSSLVSSQVENFHLRNTFRERKHTLAKIDSLPQSINDVYEALLNSKLISLIEQITGIHDLESDPTLYAGGLSAMKHGDFLNPHIDNSHDASRRRYRRLNILFYCTPDWQEANGAHLELWDKRVTKPFTIESKFNRLVIMETNEHSWHSVSRNVSTGVRMCVSTYFFSKVSPSGREYYHVTSFMGRPDEPFKRAYSKLDNKFRQLISKTIGLGRGKGLSRDVK